MKIFSMEKHIGLIVSCTWTRIWKNVTDWSRDYDVDACMDGVRVKVTMSLDWKEDEKYAMYHACPHIILALVSNFRLVFLLYHQSE